jgi:hypothetical protein
VHEDYVEGISVVQAKKKSSLNYYAWGIYSKIIKFIYPSDNDDQLFKHSLSQSLVHKPVRVGQGAPGLQDQELIEYIISLYP